MTLPRLRYQTLEFGDIDIHLCTLRDTQEFSDPQGEAENLGINSATWSLFGVVWPSSLVLAHFLNDFETSDKRILEVGCGMALSSLLLNKRNDDITATDYHPEAEMFLQRNTLLNGDRDIAFERVGWADDEDSLGRFDLIVGSDVLYEDDHIDLLANFLNNHAQPACEIVLVDPGRGRKSKLSTRMAEFGFEAAHEKPQHTDYLQKAYKGDILRFRRSQ